MCIRDRYRALGDQMGLRRLPRLVLCPSLPAPMLAGLLRPVTVSYTHLDVYKRQ